MSDKIYNPFSLDAWREFISRAVLDQRCRDLKAEKQKIADELVSFIHKEHAKVCAERDWLLSEVEQLKKSATRYEYLRKLDPNKFSNIWQKNITTGIPFDTLVNEAIEQKHA